MTYKIISLSNFLIDYVGCLDELISGIWHYLWLGGHLLFGQWAIPKLLPEMNNVKQEKTNPKLGFRGEHWWIISDIS